LVVIGAGHLKGMSDNLRGHLPENPSEQLTILEQVPPGSQWTRFIPWIIMVLVLAGFAIGFSRNTDLGLQMVLDWVVINGGLAALGALIAKAHPVTIIGTFFAAPFTSLNPTIGAGMVAAGIEIAMRKPTVGDFSKLRQDVTEMKGWWRNRVSRTLLVFMLATLGSAMGTYIGGFRIFGQLTGG
jgi:pheromone shutdown protein TraB